MRATLTGHKGRLSPGPQRTFIPGLRRVNSGAPPVQQTIKRFSSREFQVELSRFCRLLPSSLADNCRGLGRRSTTTWCSGRRLGVWKKANGFGSMPRRSRPTGKSTIRSTVSCCTTAFDVTRWLGRLREWEGIGFVDHTRLAKRRSLNIRNHRGKKRADASAILIKVASKTAHYGEQALAASAQWSDPLSLARAEQLAHYLELLHKVIEQTQRGLSGEAVAAQEKICSVFSTPTFSRRPSGNGLRSQGLSQHGAFVADPGLCGGTGESGR